MENQTDQRKFTLDVSMNGAIVRYCDLTRNQVVSVVTRLPKGCKATMRGSSGIEYNSWQTALLVAIYMRESFQSHKVFSPNLDKTFLDEMVPKSARKSILTLVSKDRNGSRKKKSKQNALA